MSNDTTTPESEVNETSEETVNDEQVTEETLGSLQDEETTQEKKVPTEVPKARLDKEIERRKALESELEELKKTKEADSSVSDTEKDPDVKELAEKLAKIEESEKSAKRDAKLSEKFSEYLEEAPEFKDVANLAVLKQMALLPQNKDKTIPQLFEEVYGNTITGRRTVETTTPRGGAADTKVDIERAQKDAAYRKEVFANPDLKKQYNEGLTDRLSSVL